MHTMHPPIICSTVSELRQQGGLVAELLFDLALEWPLVHDKRSLEETNGTYLAAEKVEV